MSSRLKGEVEMGASIYMCVHMYTRMSICMYAYEYMYVSVCVYVFVHTHRYTHSSSSALQGLGEFHSGKRPLPELP